MLQLLKAPRNAACNRAMVSTVELQEQKAELKEIKQKAPRDFIGTGLH